MDMLITAVNVLCLIFYAMMAYLCFKTTKQIPSHIYLFYACLDISIWTYLLVLAGISTDAELAANLRFVSGIPCQLFYALCLRYMVEVAEYNIFSKEQRQKSTYKHLVFVPAIILIPLYTLYSNRATYIWNEYFGWSPPFSSHFPDHRIMYLLLLYTLLYIILESCIILYWRKTAETKREKSQVNIASGAFLLIGFLCIVVDIIIPKTFSLPYLSVSAIVFGIPILGVAIIINKFSFMSGVWLSFDRIGNINLESSYILKNIVDIMQDGLIISDRRGTIKQVNQKTADLIGCPISSLLRKKIDELFYEQLPDLKEHNYCIKEVSLLLLNGDKIPVMLSSTVLRDDSDDCIGFLILFHNLSEVKKLEDELRMIDSELEVRVQKRTAKLIAANKNLYSVVRRKLLQEEEMRRTTDVDPVTNLFSTKKFEADLKRLSDTEHGAKRFAIMLLNLEYTNLKNNDITKKDYEERRKRAAVDCAGLIRAYVAEEECIYWNSDEEFIILVRNIEETDVYSLRKSLTLNLMKSEGIRNIQIGCAFFPEDGYDKDRLLNVAAVDVSDIY